MTNSMFRCVLLVVGLLGLVEPSSASAQVGRGPFRALSFDIGSLQEQRYGGEFETCAEHGPTPGEDFYIGCFISFGVTVHSGETQFDSRGGRPPARVRYVDADVFIRMLFGDSPFNGWAFSLGTGVTAVMRYGPRPGVGVDLHRSWRFGRHLYVSPGVGVKGVLGMPEDANVGLIPAVRLNVGIAY